MKVLLRDSLSILEYIYLLNYEKRMLVEGGHDKLPSTKLESSISRSDIVIGCRSTDLFYGKTIIINNDSYDKEVLTDLAKHNEVISRFKLDLGIDYELEPYDHNIKMDGLKFNGTSTETMSKLSIENFIIHKRRDEGFVMQKPKMFMSTKINGDCTIIGFLKEKL